MTNNGRGFELVNACILGNQGTLSPAVTYDNEWIGFTAGNYHTYNSGSVLSSSILYVRSTPATYVPTLNGSSAPLNEYTTASSGFNYNASIKVITAPTNTIAACPALPPPPPTNGSGRQIAERAVQDSIDYPILPTQNLYKAQLKYFKLIIMNDSILDSSATNIGKLVAIESNLAQGNIATAQSMNAALAPSNTIESNYKMFYASAINSANNTLTVSDSVTLINLAQSCPAISGDVVYQARALYNAIMNQYQYFEDNCNYDSLITGARMAAKTLGISSVTAKKSSYLVYPNPTTGIFYISTSNRNDATLNVEIQDLTGRIISKQTLPATNGVVTLQNTLVNGVYMINITGSDGKMITQKLVVNN